MSVQCVAESLSRCRVKSNFSNYALAHASPEKDKQSFHENNNNCWSQVVNWQFNYIAGRANAAAAGTATKATNLNANFQNQSYQLADSNVIKNERNMPTNLIKSMLLTSLHPQIWK